MPADLADFRRGIQRYLREKNCPLISLIAAEESKAICVYLRHLREKNCPLISLIFAEESKAICVYLRHLREKNCTLISLNAVIKPYL